MSAPYASKTVVPSPASSKGHESSGVTLQVSKGVGLEGTLLYRLYIRVDLDIRVSLSRTEIMSLIEIKRDAPV